MNNDPDIEAVEAAAGGDRQAFNRLVLKYQKPILNLCIRLTGSYENGEDAAQEVFVKVYRNMGKFKGASLFSTWLYRIAVNHCHNFRQSFWQRLIKSSEAPDREIVNGDPTPAEALDRKRKSQKILSALKGMKKRERELVVLRDLQEMSYEEIAQVMKLPMGTVKSAISRARRVLKGKLEGMNRE